MKKVKKLLALTAAGTVGITASALAVVACGSSSPSSSQIVIAWNRNFIGVSSLKIKIPANGTNADIVKNAPPFKTLYGPKYTAGLENKYESPKVDTNFTPATASWSEPFPGGMPFLYAKLTYLSKDKSLPNFSATLSVSVDGEATASAEIPEIVINVVRDQQLRYPEEADFRAESGQWAGYIPAGYVYDAIYDWNPNNWINGEQTLIFKNDDAGLLYLNGLTQRGFIGDRRDYAVGAHRGEKSAVVPEVPEAFILRFSYVLVDNASTQA